MARSAHAKHFAELWMAQSRDKSRWSGNLSPDVPVAQPFHMPVSAAIERQIRKYQVFPSWCVAAGLPRPLIEHRFHGLRRWRFDWAWPVSLIAVECEGGIWRKGGGAHSHPSNIERDLEKYNAAAMLGWRILRYAPEDLGNAIHDLRIILAKS